MIPRDGELHRFIHRELASEEALNIALLLAAHPTRKWTPEEVLDQLKIDDGGQRAIASKRVELRLQDLWEKGLVKRDVTDGRYAYDGLQKSAHRFIEELRALSPEDSEEAKALAYVRPRTGASAFADAFGRMRGDR
jgi:hypothetical protein